MNVKNTAIKFRLIVLDSVFKVIIRFNQVQGVAWPYRYTGGKNRC